MTSTPSKAPPKPWTIKSILASPWKVRPPTRMANATLMATIVALQVRPAKAQGHDFAKVVFGFAALGFLAFLWLLWGIVSWLCRRRPAQEPPEEEAAQVEERAATPPPPRAARQRKALARATGAQRRRHSSPGPQGRPLWHSTTRWCRRRGPKPLSSSSTRAPGETKSICSRTAMD